MGEIGTAAEPERRRPWLPPRWFIRTAWVVHRGIHRVSGGRLGLWPPRENRFGTMVLHTVGRRTGSPHRAIVAYALDGPDVVTVAMNGWGEGHPAWWLNLQAHPETTVDLPDGSRAVRARAATGDERDRLWRTWLRFDPQFDAYAAHRRTETVVVVLEPAPDLVNPGQDP
ncbi:nitroreductase/quinone reductase family protein [Cellulomonas wangsupingiae]|uniref:Nitroreductase family deazaflavin-dependent oxidoreductase n=1 Tax=Cellulomonas wangsupingiae TaxID=2968085 RepID=A0ABY5K5K4_9CELL|nr:nitroreductase/quinone reductase family protein [Cellulomonas wangsupingiae]MCC2333786.1 nitroreductase family deazaflavin-dependent oxidoreductase [Cellulomonas wangsupingiae]UUI65049.1 nitroreductase family deazaflavin-dependent oxidoreductase [Cellulomonas wangsupingiae]